MTPDEAVDAGAMALFGEKYGDEVRVVSMGGDDGNDLFDRAVRRHPCARTGDIGLFKIVGEGAVAAGVRRIEAVTGAAAEEHVRHEARLLAEAAAVAEGAARGSAGAAGGPGRGPAQDRARAFRSAPGPGPAGRAADSPPRPTRCARWAA